MNSLLDSLNFLLTFIFIFEFGIKIVGYGYRYFRDSWNTFDMVIITFSIAGIIFTKYGD
jgi:hypothetical protein